jgi:hypothetical protein
VLLIDMGAGRAMRQVARRATVQLGRVAELTSQTLEDGTPGGDDRLRLQVTDGGIRRSGEICAVVIRAHTCDSRLGPDVGSRARAALLREPTEVPATMSGATSCSDSLGARRPRAEARAAGEHVADRSGEFGDRVTANPRA